MLYQERESPWKGESQTLRHQHSASSDASSRALIPMWDSSDPERAPPPLPLNPQSPSVSSRPGTSTAIQSAHAALNERARESAALVPPPLTKRVGDASLERSPPKASPHRRMQSLQPGTVRDLGLMLEGSPISANRSPERRRPNTPTPIRNKDTSSDLEARDDESAAAAPISVPGPSLTPILRPAARRPPPQSILGENTPPQSSTMLALQSMSSQSSLRQSSEPPLSNITNQSNVSTKSPQSLEGISAQILSLTNIATSLQKEMGALSRRSRDNATDLLSLKEATSTRDEDIRRSLRDVLGNISEASSRVESRDFGAGFLLDNKPHGAASPNGRPFQLPKIPSPKSFSNSLDRSLSHTRPDASSGAESMALLEQIHRDMGTKHRQDALISRLTEVSEKLGGMATASKVQELIQFVREQPSNTMVRGGTDVDTDHMQDLDHDRAMGGPMTKRVELLLNHPDHRRSSAPSGRGVDLLNEDLLKIIRSVKDSVAQGGGLTAEVKALVRELRGEVLGMGRELGKKLEQADRRTLEDVDMPSQDNVSRVIDEGLEQMKEQLNNVLREHRRQSAGSIASSKSLVDYQEIYNAMRAALRDNEASRADMPDLSREDVIEAVREAWANYKPEIETQQLGLEREEVLACLQEGLQDYNSRNDREQGATRDEVFQAVVEGFKHFVPPQMGTSATISRDEIIEAVRDCLEEFEFPVAAAAIGNDTSHKDMVQAVREGIRGLNLNEGSSVLSAADTGEISFRLQELMDYMRSEFQAVSEEAKQNVAANGRDTEQVLDATKDGLENLRIAIESYVDRSTGAASQDEFFEDLLSNMDSFKSELSNLVAQATDSSREQLKLELENLREMVNSSMVPAAVASHSDVGANNQEVLEALQNGVNTLRQEFHRPRNETTEILDALDNGVNELRDAMEKINNRPVDLTANDEILDALKTGIDSLRSEIRNIQDARDSPTDKAVATVSDSAPEHSVMPPDMLKHDDIHNLEVLISHLRIKVDAMAPESGPTSKEDLTRMEEMLRNVQQGVEQLGARETNASGTRETSANDGAASTGDAASKDDVQAIETILRNTKARLDDLVDGEQAVRKDHLDAIETLVLETRENMGSMTEQMDALSQKQDVATMQTLLSQISEGVDEMKEHAAKDLEDPEKVSKTDIEAVETVVLELKTLLDGLATTDFNSLSQKDDVSNLEGMLKDATATLDALKETTAQALDDRQAEIVGVGERVAEVKTFLEELQDTVKTKLDEGSTGVESLGKLLDTMSEKVDKNETVGDDLKEMMELMKTGFEESKDVVAGAKLETDDKLNEATESIGTKIDEKIGELMSKYEELQSAMDEKSKGGEARDIETAAAVVGTKAVADDLKLLMDTLGSTVTESLEKMEEASKTVFSRVEDLAARTDEMQTEDKSEHQQTREQVQQAVTIIEGLQGGINDYQPQILEAVKDVLLLVGQHYEHSKSTATDLQDKIIEARPSDQQMLTAPERYDDSEVREKLNRLAEEKYDDSEVRSKLDSLVNQKYDDAGLHDKLDKLVDHSANAEKAFAQLDTIDKVHQSVLQTAADISEFLSGQDQRSISNVEDHEKKLQDTSLAIERALGHQSQVEASIASLREEEERLRSSVLGLRTEQESLIRQKTRLTGDVSSLQTAMRLRKEELADMEFRAESLERRILEGVMDHSRVLLMSQGDKSGKEAMSRKRVKKTAAATQQGGSQPSTKEVASAKTPRRSAVNMALSNSRNLASPAQNGSARRIVSLSQINSNTAASPFKRTQSVRTPVGGGSGKALRKRSWGGDLGRDFGGEDKENMGMRDAVEEVEEPDTPGAALALYNGNTSRRTSLAAGDSLTVLDSTLADEEDDDNAEERGDGDGDSDTGTLRRSSYGTTVLSGSTGLYTESDVGYSEYGDDASEYTESAMDTAGAVEIYGQ